MGTLRRTFGRDSSGSSLDVGRDRNASADDPRRPWRGARRVHAVRDEPDGRSGGRGGAAAKGFAAFAFDPPKGDAVLVEADALKSPSALNAPSLVNLADCAVLAESAASSAEARARKAAREARERRMDATRVAGATPGMDDAEREVIIILSV